MDLSSEAVKTLIAHGAQTAQLKELHNGDQVIILPEGYEHSVFKKDEYRLTPFIQASPTFLTDTSLIAYVNEYKSPTTKIFANDSVVRAVLNYHSKEAAAHASHIAVLTLKHSREWSAWMEVNGRPLDQKTFAEFIEENLLNVLDPDGATMVELVSTLESKTEVEFSSNIRNDNGTQRLVFDEKQTAQGTTSKGKMDIPRKIKLGLPVFKGGDPYPMEAFLRTRINAGKATFIVKLDNPTRVSDKAFSDVCAEITNQTGLAILEGSFR